MRGKLVVFEGTDGAGKATQARLLARRLEEEGIPFREIDFPRYGNPFAEPARLYLQGQLGGRPEDVNAFASSVFLSVSVSLAEFTCPFFCASPCSSSGICPCPPPSWDCPGKEQPEAIKSTHNSSPAALYLFIYFPLFS